MKNTNYILTEDEKLKLNDLITKDLYTKVLEKLPKNHNLEKSEIISELWNTVYKLSNSYVPGDLSFTSYVYQYAVLYTARDIWRDYKDNKKYIHVDFSDEETFNQIIKNEIIKEKITMSTIGKIELSDDVKNVVLRMSPGDFLIAKMIMCGMSYDLISEIVGISKGQISKRMQNYKKVTAEDFEWLKK